MSLEETLSSIAASGLPLQEKLDALKHEFETRFAPAPVVEMLHRSIDELVASGAADWALGAGNVAPPFTLHDADGASVSSQELLARGPLVLSFYRGVWCPYCNFELQALEAARPQIEARGASLVAISPQTAANSRKSRRQNDANFQVLVDAGNEVGRMFGVVWTVPAYLREVHRQLGADLTQFNGDESWTLPMPARFIVGQDGVIAYAEVSPDYTRRPEPSEMLPVLDVLEGGRAA